MIIYNAGRLDTDHYPDTYLKTQYPNEFYVVDDGAFYINQFDK